MVKRAVMSVYKFGLAFENTRDVDYITEKIFEVLMVRECHISMLRVCMCVHVCTVLMERTYNVVGLQNHV